MIPLGLKTIYIASISTQNPTYIAAIDRGIHIGEKTHHQDQDITSKTFNNMNITKSKAHKNDASLIGLMKPLGLKTIFIASISPRNTTNTAAINRGIHIGEKTHHQDQDIRSHSFNNMNITKSKIYKKLYKDDASFIAL